MAKTKDITPEQYAEWYGCEYANITKHIRKGTQLPHVISIKNWSRFYLLEVPENLTEATFSRDIIKPIKK